MHNGWAGALSELGLVGMTIYLLLIYRSCIGGVWKASYSIPQAIQRMGFLGVLSAMVLSIGGDALLQRTTLIFMAISAAGRDYFPRNAIILKRTDDDTPGQ